MFDLPREQVTDAMIDALYQNEAMTFATPARHETPERLAVGACF